MHLAHSHGARWRLGLVVCAAIGLMYQSLLVQTHLHGIGGVNTGLWAGLTAQPAQSLDAGFAHRRAPCLLCQEKAMAGHYTIPPPISHVGESFAILQIPSPPHLAAIQLRRGLPSRHPRGPPRSYP